jgi:pectate lyase
MLSPQRPTPDNFVLDAVDEVPEIVIQGAGAGKVTF